MNCSFQCSKNYWKKSSDIAHVGQNTIWLLWFEILIQHGVFLKISWSLKWCGMVSTFVYSLGLSKDTFGHAYIFHRNQLVTIQRVRILAASTWTIRCKLCSSMKFSMINPIMNWHKSIKIDICSQKDPWESLECPSCSEIWYLSTACTWYADESQAKQSSTISYFLRIFLKIVKYLFYSWLYLRVLSISRYHPRSYNFIIHSTSIINSL